MPELPEVETVKNGLAPVWTGQTIKSVVLNRPNLRYPFHPRFKEELEGAELQHLTRRGKYMVGDFGHVQLIMHLGMSGSFRIETLNPSFISPPSLPKGSRVRPVRV